MYPNFVQGDVVWMEKVPGERLRFWDVVFWKSRKWQGISFHRIWWKRKLKDGGYTLRTKGDFNWKLDAPIHSDEVLGAGIAVYRFSDWFFFDSFFKRTVQGLKGLFFLFIYAPVLALGPMAEMGFGLVSGRRGAHWRWVRLFLFHILTLRPDEGALSAA